jgi:hypothetical protein
MSSKHTTLVMPDSHVAAATSPQHNSEGTALNALHLMLTKTPPHTLATAEGHLDAHRQGIQSTQPKPVLDNECSFPASETAKTPGASIVVQFYDTKNETDIDPAGRLPIHTELGGDYHVVFYHYDGNYARRVCQR